MSLNIPALLRSLLSNKNTKLVKSFDLSQPLYRGIYFLQLKVEVRVVFFFGGGVELAKAEVF